MGIQTTIFITHEDGSTEDIVTLPNYFDAEEVAHTFQRFIMDGTLNVRRDDGL